MDVQDLKLVLWLSSLHGMKFKTLASIFFEHIRGEIAYAEASNFIANIV